jgi:hypothetical protein
MKRLAIILALCAPCFGQLWSGVIDPSRAINWSNTGAQQIATTRTQCGSTIAAYGSSGSYASPATINSALAACPYNGYVQLGPGNFYLNAGLYFPNGGSFSSGCSSNCSNITLRGSGANSTFIYFNSTSNSGANCGGHVVCAASTDLNYTGGPSNTANWTGASATSTVTAGTYTQGGTYISLSSVSNLSVGWPIILDQVDDQADTGAVYLGCEIGSTYSGNPTPNDTSPACSGFAHTNGYERGGSALATIRGQQQIVNVVSISGSGPYTVQVTPGIYAPNWRTSQSPGAWWATHPVENDGVENLYINMTATGSATGIDFFNCTGCWAKGVAAVMEASGGTGWHSVGFDQCNHCTVRDSYHYGYTGDDYGFATYIGSDILFENNIGNFPAESMFNNSDCEGCVETYNFNSANYYGADASWLEQPDDFHGIQLYSLQEGNIGAGMYADSIHGSHAFNTYFRNRWDGNQQNNGTNTTQNTTSLNMASGARYNNVIANVLGTTGYHTAVFATNLSGGYDNATYAIGQGAADFYAIQTSLFWGNWDSVTNGVRWCGNSSDTGWSTTCGGKNASITSISEGTGPSGPPTTDYVTVTSTLNPGAGNTVLISGVGTAGYNGYYEVTSSGSSSFQYVTLTTGLGTDTGGGTATVGSMVPTVLPNITYATFENAVPTLGDTGAGQGALPASFIYSSKPPWWPSGKAWPTIGPDVTGGNVGQCSGGTYNSAEVTTSQSSQCSAGGGTFAANSRVISNPAMDCFFNVMGGSATSTSSVGPLSFNAASCYSNSPSFSASPVTIPANHSGHITVTLTGSGTSWNGSTSFTISGVTGASLVSSTNNSATSQTLVITTGSGTGTLTISDTTDSISTTVAVNAATISCTPSSGNVLTAPSLTCTGTSTLWSSETASTLLSVSGGSGASLATPTVSSNTALTVTLTVGSATGTLTTTDNSTTATTTFTATTGSPTSAPSPSMFSGSVVIGNNTVSQNQEMKNEEALRNARSR